MSDSTFDGPAGVDYDLIEQVNPHYDKLRSASVALLQCELQPLIDPKIQGILDLNHKCHAIDVLEPGCGTGLTTKKLLDLDHRIRLHAIDHSPSMIKKAAEYLNLRPIYDWNGTVDYTDSIVRMFGDFTTSSAALLLNSDIQDELALFGDNYFHAVVSTFMLHDLTERQRNWVIFNLHRVLRPGGIFINADKMAVNDPVLHQQQLESRIQKLDLFERLGKPELKREWLNHYREENQRDTLMTEKAYLGTLERTGFQNIETFYRQDMEAIVIARKGEVR